MDMLSYFPLIIQGIATTLACWTLAMMGSLSIGITAGILACHHLRLTRWQNIIGLYSFIVKAIPAYVQILIAYFAIPALLNIQISGFTAATGALVISSSGYISEIVRSGINSVAIGQWRAAYVLGYSSIQTLRNIILPQAIPIMLPPLMGESEQLLKSTSLLATIGIMEVTRAGMNIISRELNPVPVYTLIACIYLSFSGILQLCIRWTLKRYYYANR